MSPPRLPRPSPARRPRPRALGLRFAGVDLIATGPDDPAPVVLEVNAGPGLSYFHRLGAREAETVERIYEGLVDALLS